MSADGSGQRNLTGNTGFDWFHTWSPDGQKIAFLRGGGGVAGRGYVMNADGTRQRNLKGDAFPDHGEPPSWSPDGRKIAFARGYPNSEVYIVNADGSGLRRLTRGPAADHSPVWSPALKK